MLKKLKKKPKIIIYSLIVYIPLIVLLLVISLFAIRLYNINSIDYNQDYNQLDYSLTSRSESTKIPDFQDLESNLEITTDDDFLIYVYGSSSVVIPSRSQAFPFYLQRKLQKRYNKTIKVINYGFSGIDSHILKNIFKKTIDIKKPDLIIIYAGHNDYTIAYKKFIKPNYYFIKRHVMERLLIFLNLDKLIRPKFTGVIQPDFSWFLENKLEPLLINFFQKIGLINLDQKVFQRYNDLILDYYSKNVLEIMNFSEKREIPLIFITPIGNLEAEPFGIYRITTKNYRAGIKEENYSKRIEYLVKAKDNEIFTEDIRAKSDLNNFLRDLNKTNVYVLDLEKDFKRKKFSFSYMHFYDYFHFLPETHARITTTLYLFILENNLIRADVKN
jgi:lysophospholipase L1-like esterase